MPVSTIKPLDVLATVEKMEARGASASTLGKAAMWAGTAIWCGNRVGRARCDGRPERSFVRRTENKL
ncbi:hypothetical protein C7W93_14230 [Glaciimonas sp. PCH181]|nr:hypothetical protein C7W93_14230 [Glaciimonas sp. PCH181]